MSNNYFIPNHWVVGDPAYIRNDGTWEFFPQEPIHVMDYAEYQTEMIARGELNETINEVINYIMDSVLVVDMAIENMMYPYSG